MMPEVGLTKFIVLKRGSIWFWFLVFGLIGCDWVRRVRLGATGWRLGCDWVRLGAIRSTGLIAKDSDGGGLGCLGGEFSLPMNKVYRGAGIDERVQGMAP